MLNYGNDFSPTAKCWHGNFESSQIIAPWMVPQNTVNCLQRASTHTFREASRKSTPFVTHVWACQKTAPTSNWDGSTPECRVRTISRPIKPMLTQGTARLSPASTSLVKRAFLMKKSAWMAPLASLSL